MIWQGSGGVRSGCGAGHESITVEANERVPAVSLREICLPFFLESGNEALDPSQNGGVYDRDAALRHQVAHVAITQHVRDIPPHGLNDKKMIEMTAFEEFRLLGRELCHAEDYP